MKINGETVSDWGSDYEKEYKNLMEKLLFAGVATAKGSQASSNVFISGIATLSSMAYYSINKELGISEAEKFMANPTCSQARAVCSINRCGMSLKKIICSQY
jgi:hypothetical protein